MRQRILVVSSVVVAVGCLNSQAPDDSSGATGSVRVGAAISALHDVTAIRFDVVAADAACGTPPLVSATYELEAEGLSAELSASGAAHPFADALFVLAAGDYRVCALPLSGDEPSEDCAPSEMLVEVHAAETAEVVLVSECEGDPSGGLDVVVALNEPPEISAVTLESSKFITVCETLHITVDAVDPDGDELDPAYTFSIVEAPMGVGALLVPDGATAAFSGGEGDYVLGVRVFDVHGRSAYLTFPVHVSDATCAVPPAVQAIFEARCSPCHIPNAASGVSFATAEISYQSLVGQPSAAAACATRTRVIPRDPENSYLIDKLRAAPDICGLPMPRGRDPLPEEEIAVIEAWIHDLPVIPSAP